MSLKRSAKKRLAKPRLKVKALLLDLDGTLVDSSEALKEAGRAGFIALGLPEVHEEKGRVAGKSEWDAGKGEAGQTDHSSQGS
jgi:beta-phosphoglucomutase-like phosphatase (HAD superfamily)